MGRKRGANFESNRARSRTIGKWNASQYSDVAFDLGDTWKWTEEIARQVENDIRPLMVKIQKAATARIKSNSVRSGALARSIKTKFVTKQKKGVWKTWAGVGVDKNHAEDYDGKRIRPIAYAHFIEEGFTHTGSGEKIESKPFMSRAVALVGGKAKAQEIVTQAIQKAIGKGFK